MKRLKIAITMHPEVLRVIEKIAKRQPRLNVKRSQMIEEIILRDKEVQKEIKVKNL